ncbi:hypothetical protein AJ80_05157 [Polytolypa hystricis UAMH7299]|uniref:Uncharacterized protein n=1 Tax=Polytolypa hystricis (strain UAMH7299) TaxID=1447883 RepID=A0A2B7Y628_POLH7|nr:hypothetical protein AJ80_05157 [Polytolypa hystricis UAMH7299]
MADIPIPIAVIGIGCRLPGGANTPEALWRMLAEGRDGWAEVPTDRFNWRSFLHPDAEMQGMHNHRGGHFLSQDISAFDSSFFNIPPFECEAIDPQQRIQLEVAYESLENAGVSIDRIRGSNTAVYVATFSQDYAQMQFKDLDDLPKYHMTGTGTAIMSNRISYVFDLKGPSMSIDTGCSGGLVAIHQACQSLRSGECEMALAGGVNLLLSPDLMIPMSLMHILNDDGKCYSFDTRGSGYGRGEGAAMVVLKRLDDAIRDGDNIRAVIRNTGVNHDGLTPGITLPSRQAQRSLIQSVYQRAGLDPRDTAYVEAHGTGTAVGDDEEISAIQSLFAESQGARTNPLYVGTIKPNIGHLESASGIVGFIKAVLMLEKGMIPPNLNLRTLKKSLKLDKSKIIIPSQLEHWPMGSSRRVSLNSFGYGGTNGHAILEAADCSTRAHAAGKFSNHLNGCSRTHINGHMPAPVNGLSMARSGTLSDEHDTGSPQVLVLTAKSEKSLTKAAENLCEWISSKLDQPDSHDQLLVDLAHSLISRRSLMQWRHSFTACSLRQALSSLNSKLRSPVRSATNNRIVFLFTGQGAQWFAMGRELMATSSIYRESMNKSDQILAGLGAPWSVVEELSKDKQHSRINASEFAQPATTAVQIALVDLLRSIGVKPDIVLGHSSGEIAAAYAAGGLSQHAALMVAYHRGALARLSRKGAMLAVGLGEEDVLPYLSKLKSGVAVVACSNSSSSSTISGDPDAIAELHHNLDAESIFARQLKVTTAYHSHHTLDIADDYLRSLHDLEFGMVNASVKFVSTVTGAEMSVGFGPKYWVQNLVSKVKFHDAMKYVCDSLHNSARSPLAPPTAVFVELGPHNALAGPIRQGALETALASNFFSFCALSRNSNAVTTFLELSSRLFERGCQIDLASANLLARPSQSQQVLSDLPPYAWDHSNHHWHESRLSKAHRFRQFPYHDLLGVRIVSSTSLQPVWRHVFTVKSLPWLREHTIDDVIIFPAAAYMCMAIEAIRQVVLGGDEVNSQPISKYVLKDVAFVNALMIPDTSIQIEIQIIFNPIGNAPDKMGSKWWRFQVVSVSSEGVSVDHCRGRIMAKLPTTKNAVEDVDEDSYVDAGQSARLDRMRTNCFKSIDCASLYSDLKSRGNYYGPNFACAKVLNLDDNSDDALGTVIIPNAVECMPARFSQPHVIHPGTLDALLHAPIPLFNRRQDSRSVMAIGIGELSISANMPSAPDTKLTTASSLSYVRSGSAAAEISVFQTGENGKDDLLIHIVEAELRATGRSDEENSWRDMSYQMKWDLDVTQATSAAFTASDEDTTAEELAQEQKFHCLNRAAAIYIQSCLHILSQSNLRELSGHHGHLFNWMNRFYKSGEYENLVSDIQSPEAAESVIQLAQESGVEGAMLCRVGAKLPEILTGHVDPLALMIEDDLLYRLYADDASTRCYAHMVRYMQSAVFKDPNMKILELGAGTGGATVPLLQALNRNGTLPIQRYDFTDVSAGFFERSKAKLQEWSNYIQFKKLDIQEDLPQQGFEEASYDIIIASNVLHVANYIDASLSQVRSLLKPGGRLLMIETTRVVPFYNTFLGVLPGWWGGVNDGRTDAPILTVDQWGAALLRTGFNGIDISAKDFEGPAQRSAMLVSTAVANIDKVVSGVTTIPVRLILCPTWLRQPPAFVVRLSHVIQKMGLDVSMGALDTEVSISRDVLYIMLDDGAKPMLTTHSPTLFAKITKFLVNSSRMVWISAQEDGLTTVNPEKGLITGVARVARGENQLLKLVTMNIQEDIRQGFECVVAKVVDVIMSGFYEPEGYLSNELEYVYRDGQLYIPRLVLDTKINQHVRHAAGEQKTELQPFHQLGRPLRLQVHHSGLLEKLHFVDYELEALADSDIEIQVEACGINFKDVLISLGQVRKPIPMGGEYAGTVVKVSPSLHDRFKVGDRVCGFGATAYASRVQINASTACHIPSNMSFVEGASIPAAFCTAHLALVDIAKLERNQSVLIHSAAGAVGQAALRIAQNIGAKIYATVGNDDKRQLLIDEFGIPAAHIFSSKNGAFKMAIRRLTEDRGVDVILNSLSGELLQDSWECIASFGTFVELGKSDAHNKTSLSMAPFDRNITFASVDLSLMQQRRPEKTGKLLADVMEKFESGTYSLINPVTTMPLTDIEDAFRLIQSRKHVGKIVLEANSATMVKALAQAPASLQLNENATYLIAGGLGGLGLEITQFMVDHGAKSIVLLSRRGLGDAGKQDLQRKFAPAGAKVAVFSCDITNLASLKETISTCARSMPPIKGVIQASMVLRDRVLSQMDLDEFQAAIHPKVTGTQTLIKALESENLDFFLMLSSGASIIGNLSQANYAAGNAFMDTLADSAQASGIPFLSLNLGPISDAGAVATSTRLKQILIRQGYVLLKLKELLASIKYSMTKEARQDECKQIILGFDHRSLLESDNQYSLQNPMFCHLLRSQDSHVVSTNGDVVQSLETAIAAAEGIEQVENIIAEAIARKISTLVAVSYDEIDLQQRVVEFGLDSLVVIELKNWVKQEFQATLQASEISDAPHILSLASTVASKSGLVANTFHCADGNADNHDKSDPPPTNGASRDDAEASGPILQRKQPLPGLDESLDQYLEAVQPVLTDEEYALTLSHVREFRKPGGFGHILQARLSQLANDPQVDNWQAELYARRAYLRDRVALVPRWNFFGTHFISHLPHSPAQRAAVISTAAYQFKQKLEAGELRYELVNDQPIGMELYNWFFNATRKPCLQEDKMMKFPGNDYLVAFRRGHVYKIPLHDAHGPVSYHKLKGMFQGILDTSQKPVSWAGVLTADGRDSWAQVRKLLKRASPENKLWLRTIEAAAFVISLDEARPLNAAERGQQFLHANGFNRWSDKTVQFAVCDNGVSATIGEHAMLDGVVIRRLNDHITAAIMELQPDTFDNLTDVSNGEAIQPVEGFAFQTTAVLDEHIFRVRSQVDNAVSRYEFAAFDLRTVNSAFFRQHKCPPKSGMQLAIQLAVRKHFGYNPTAFEPVSLSHFLKGRVELNHVLWSEVAEFCAAASPSSSEPLSNNSALRTLFFEGVKAHAKNLVRASRGYGIDRHLLCLEWSIQEGEIAPALFSSPLYKKGRNSLVMTDCLSTGALECGAVQPDPGSFWIHFEPEEDRVRFSIWGPTGETGNFQKLVEESVEQVRAILES